MSQALRAPKGMSLHIAVNAPDPAQFPGAPVLKGCDNDARAMAVHMGSSRARLSRSGTTVRFRPGTLTSGFRYSGGSPLKTSFSTLLFFLCRREIPTSRNRKSSRFDDSRRRSPVAAVAFTINVRDFVVIVPRADDHAAVELRAPTQMSRRA